MSERVKRFKANNDKCDVVIASDTQYLSKEQKGYYDKIERWKVAYECLAPHFDELMIVSKIIMPYVIFHYEIYVIVTTGHASAHLQRTIDDSELSVYLDDNAREEWLRKAAFGMENYWHTVSTGNPLGDKLLGFLKKEQQHDTEYEFLGQLLHNWLYVACFIKY
jgi:hypothetical protein